MSVDPRMVPAELAARYQPLRVLGAGAMGHVVAAQDVVLRREVALKILRPDAADAGAPERFAVELRILARLSHPGVVCIYDGGRTGDVWYLLMESLPGRSLLARAQEGPMEPAALARLLEGILEALAYLHGQDVLHRDLKPSNVQLVQDDRPVLLDFGVAWHADLSRSFTAVGQVIGTPAYLAPELLRGGPFGARTDLFAAGQIALELLTGRALHSDRDAADPVHLLSAKLSGTYVEDARRDLRAHPEWSDWILRSIALDPADRPESAAEMLASMPAPGAKAGKPATRRATGKVRRLAREAAPPVRREHPGGRLAAALLAGGVLLTVAMLARSRVPAEPRPVASVLRSATPAPASVSSPDAPEAPDGRLLDRDLVGPLQAVIERTSRQRVTATRPATEAKAHVAYHDCGATLLPLLKAYEATERTFQDWRNDQHLEFQRLLKGADEDRTLYYRSHGSDPAIAALALELPRVLLRVRPHVRFLLCFEHGPAAEFSLGLRLGRLLQVGVALGAPRVDDEITTWSAGRPARWYLDVCRAYVAYAHLDQRRRMAMLDAALAKLAWERDWPAQLSDDPEKLNALNGVLLEVRDCARREKATLPQSLDLRRVWRDRLIRKGITGPAARGQIGWLLDSVD